MAAPLGRVVVVGLAVGRRGVAYYNFLGELLPSLKSEIQRRSK